MLNTNSQTMGSNIELVRLYSSGKISTTFWNTAVGIWQFSHESISEIRQGGLVSVDVPIYPKGAQ